MMRNSVKEKGIAGKLSTKAEPRAWQQAAREADKRAPERTTVRGSRDDGKRRSGKLSSRSLKRKRTKESGGKGETPEGDRKASTSGTAVGSEAGKDERKQTESQVQTNRKDFMGNQGERKGEPEKRKRKRRDPRSHREARREILKRKSGRPSSRSLKWKRAERQRKQRRTPE